jgi:hypothetical protein
MAMLFIYPLLVQAQELHMNQGFQLIAQFGPITDSPLNKINDETITRLLATGYVRLNDRRTD